MGAVAFGGVCTMVSAIRSRVLASVFFALTLVGLFAFAPQAAWAQVTPFMQGVAERAAKDADIAAFARDRGQQFVFAQRLFNLGEDARLFSRRGAGLFGGLDFRDEPEDARERQRRHRARDSRPPLCDRRCPIWAGADRRAWPDG